VLPIEQADNLQLARVWRARHHDVGRLEIRTTDTECLEGWVVGHEQGGHEKVAFDILDVVQRRLLLVLVCLPSPTVEREQRSTKTFHVSYFLACGCCESYLCVFVYITMLSISSDDMTTKSERETYKVLGSHRAATSPYTTYAT
jgi:hypothetical protein